MQVTETLSDSLKREYTVVIAAKDLGEKLEARLEQIGQELDGELAEGPAGAVEPRLSPSSSFSSSWSSSPCSR